MGLVGLEASNTLAPDDGRGVLSILAPTVRAERRLIVKRKQTEAERLAGFSTWAADTLSPLGVAGDLAKRIKAAKPLARLRLDNFARDVLTYGADFPGIEDAARDVAKALKFADLPDAQFYPLRDALAGAVIAWSIHPGHNNT